MYCNGLTDSLHRDSVYGAQTCPDCYLSCMILSHQSWYAGASLGARLAYALISADVNLAGNARISYLSRPTNQGQNKLAFLSTANGKFDIQRGVSVGQYAGSAQRGEVCHKLALSSNASKGTQQEAIRAIWQRASKMSLCPYTRLHTQLCSSAMAPEAAVKMQFLQATFQKACKMYAWG